MAVCPSGSTDVPPPLPNPRKPPVKGVPLSTVIDGVKNYPISVKVVSGIHGQHSGTSLYQEKILLLFEMRLKVIEALFEKGGTYQIPLCTANKFSVLHNPSDNMAQAMMGHHYDTVGHILAQQHNPKVMCVTRTFKGSSSSGSVQEGDILIIQRIHKKHIKCLNIATNEEKRLSERCAGAFTTQPERIKMSLRDIYKNIDLPVKVIVHHQLPNIVLTKHIVVTLLAKKWEESVVGSIYNSDSSDPRESPYENCQLLRFVKDNGVQVLPEDAMDNYNNACQKACHYFNMFDYSMIKVHLFNEDPIWPNHEEIQSSFYCHFERQNNWDQIVEKKKPDKAFKIMKRKSIKSTAYETLRPVDKKDVDTTAVDVIVADNPYPDKPQPPSQPSSSSQPQPSSSATTTGTDDDDEPLIDDIPDFATVLHTVNTVNRQMMIEVEGLRAEVEGLKMDLKQTKNIMGSMKKELMAKINELTYMMGGMYVAMEPNDNNAAGMKTSDEESATIQENITILKDLSHEEIVKVLKKLKMGRYLPTFTSKKITGADLSKYDKAGLRSELGITSEPDILFLSRIIQGCPEQWKVLES